MWKTKHATNEVALRDLRKQHEELLGNLGGSSDEITKMKQVMSDMEKAYRKQVKSKDEEIINLSQQAKDLEMRC
jgi:predicted  nucleic acid-binding Zn-ribbon protein